MTQASCGPLAERSDWPLHGLDERQLARWDAALAALLTGVFALLAAAQQPRATPWAVVVPVVALMGLPLALRRRRPVPVLAVTGAASVLAAALGLLVEPFLAVGCAVYAVAVCARSARRRLVRTVVALCALPPLAAVAGGAPGLSRGGQLAMAVWLSGAVVCGLAWTAGHAVRERRIQAARAAERLAASAAASAVAGERLRVARELHDSVAHHVGVIAVKAGVARHVLAVRPEEAEPALRAIDEESRAALREMRAMLGLLRSSEGPGAGPGADPGAGDAPGAALHPGYDLADLPDLARRASGAGVRVRLEAERLDGIPPELGRAAYRVVQEALTNAVKHAGPCRCTVGLTLDAGVLTVEVSDDGHGTAPSDSGGHGLLGMRERVRLHGGTFHAGPAHDGGFTVRATFPVTGGGEHGEGQHRGGQHGGGQHGGGQHGGGQHASGQEAGGQEAALVAPQARERRPGQPREARTTG